MESEGAEVGRVGSSRVARDVQAALRQHYAPLTETAAGDSGSGVGAADFRRAMGTLPTGVSILTTPGPENVWGMTVGSLTSLSMSPALLLVCLRRGSTALEFLVEHACFALSVLSDEQGQVADTFARLRDESAMSAVPTSLFGGLPVIDGAVAWFACQLREAFDVGDHVIVVGGVRHARQCAGEPLVRHASRYRQLR